MTDFAQFETGAPNNTSMQDKAAGAAEGGKQAVADVAQTAAQHAQEVKGETLRQARDLAGEARAQLQSQAVDQHRNLVGNLRSLHSELGSMADSGQGGLATELVSQARVRVGGVADWLDAREPAQILDDVRDFARRRPGLFVTGALAAGIVAGRLTRGVVDSHTSDDSASDAFATSPTAPAVGDWSAGQPAGPAGEPYPPVGGIDPLDGTADYQTTSTYPVADSGFGDPEFSRHEAGGAAEEGTGRGVVPGFPSGVER